MNGRRLTGMLWTLKWFFIVCLLVLCVDLLYVLWPYPGEARGVATLKANLAAEANLIGQLADDRSWTIILALTDGIYEVAFVWTGLDAFMQRAVDLAPLSPLNETMRRFVLGNWVFLETAATGLQLFSLRLGVLVLAMPLFFITACGAAADGLITWYLRRTGAGRESGFIYHRTKRGLALSVLVLWLVYLVPPVPLDPRWVISPFLLIAGVAVRLTVAYFKKYL